MLGMNGSDFLFTSWSLPTELKVVSVIKNLFLRFPSRPGEPLLIEITSSPSATRALPVGVPINLTCKAWQTDNVATFVRKRPRDIQWYDAQDKPVGVKCNASIKIREKELWCTLILGSLTFGAFGNYTCQASNWYGYCSRKLFEISLQGKQKHCIEGPVIIYWGGGPLKIWRSGFKKCDPPQIGVQNIATLPFERTPKKMKHSALGVCYATKCNN